jgi:PHD/YefM family antitoxin component YafN of YafNO toxin-antitoxin module
MVKYAENELFSITDFTKQLSSIVKTIKDNSIEKIGILKNNKLEVVVISTQEYSRLKNIELAQEKQLLEETLSDYKQNGSKNFLKIDKEYWNDVEARLIAKYQE